MRLGAAFYRKWMWGSIGASCIAAIPFLFAGPSVALLVSVLVFIVAGGPFAVFSYQAADDNNDRDSIE